MTDEIKFPIYTFTADGYWGRACSYNKATSLYLLKKDEKLIKLVEFEELERIIKILTDKMN